MRGYGTIVCAVTGSHVRGSEDHVFNRLDKIKRETGFNFLVSGGADYVDTLAVRWAISNHVSHAVIYPDWRYGHFAGHARNQRILTTFRPCYLVAFDGDRGTDDMIRRCKDDPNVIKIFYED